MAELRRKFFQVYMDFKSYLTPEEKMKIVRVIAERNDINYVDVSPKQAIFRSKVEGLETDPLEIKVGCDWIQVSSIFANVVEEVAKKLIVALTGEEEEREGGDS